VNSLIERHDNWRIALGDVDSSAIFDARESWREVGLSGVRVAGAAEVSVSIEVLQFGGGLTPRALIGANFVPGGCELVLEVHSSGPMTLGVPRECPSLLGSPFVAGLPTEFVPSIIDVCREMASKVELPAGTLNVYAAGYDEENSSSHAFARAGAVLLWVVRRRVLTPTEPELGFADLTAIW